MFELGACVCVPLWKSGGRFFALEGGVVFKILGLAACKNFQTVFLRGGGVQNCASEGGGAVTKITCLQGVCANSW